MAKPRWIIGGSLAVVGGVFAVAFASQLMVGLGCALNQNIEHGSDLDRFCEGWLVGAGPIVVATVVAMAGGAVSVWTLRSGPLVVAGCIGAVLAFTPYAAGESQSPDAPDPVHFAVTPSGLLVTPQPFEPLVEPLVRRTESTEEQRLDGDTTSDVHWVSSAVATCLRSIAPLHTCDDPALWRDVDPQADIRVTIQSRTRYRLVARSPYRDDTPHIFRTSMDLKRGRAVHTCTPRGRLICGREGRRVENFPPPPS